MLGGFVEGVEACELAGDRLERLDRLADVEQVADDSVAGDSFAHRAGKQKRRGPGLEDPEIGVVQSRALHQLGELRAVGRCEPGIGVSPHFTDT